MDWYLLAKLCHVVFAIVWLGAGFGLVVQGIKAIAAGDDADTVHVVKTVVAMTGVFVPASLLVLLFGLLMSWFSVGFSALWIWIGLVGYAATLSLGLGYLKGQAERFMRDLGASATPSPELVARGRRLLQVAKFDFAMLFTIVADMVLKPAAGDVGTLAVMAIVVIGAAALFLRPPSPQPALA